MSDAREALERYARSDGGQSGGDVTEDLAPRAFDALRDVLDLCDTTAGPRSGVGSRLVSAEDIRTAIQTALGDTTP